MKKTEKTIEVIVIRPFCIGYDQTRYEPGKEYSLDHAIVDRVVARGLAKLKTDGQKSRSKRR